MDANHNWIVTAYKAPSPDNMCEPFAVYIWSLHWSVMTITSIGYGDFSPQRKSEYVVCIICMFLGGILWAYVIGGVCATMGAVDPIEMEFRARYDQLNAMMDEHNLPHDLRLRVREYFRESKHSMKVKAHKELLDGVSIPLKGQVTKQQTFFPQLKEVSYFKQCGSDFLIELCLNLETELFAPREDFPEFGRLWLVVRGSASRNGQIYVPGNHIGTEFILDSLKLQYGNHIASMTFCECMVLTKLVLVDVLEDYPLETKVIRKHALMIAWRQAVRFFIKYNRSMHQENPLGMLKKELRDGSFVARKPAGATGRRMTSTNVDVFEGADDNQIASYFRDRDLRRAEREFGEHQLHDMRGDELSWI